MCAILAVGDEMRFKKIYIEISNMCNLQCPFCIQNQRPPHSLSFAQFAHVIREIKPYTQYVYLHVMGEPLLHPLLPEFLEECRKENIQVNITTNGTLLKKRWKELRHLPIRQMNISLHSFEAHHQESYIKDIVSCVEEMKDTYVSYRLWTVQEGTWNEDNKRMIEDLSSAYHISIPREHWTPSRSIPLKERVFLHVEEPFVWPSLQHTFVTEKGSCRGFIDMCAVLCDGSVTPCCLDSRGDLTLGNIFETPFSVILKQENAQRFLAGMRQHRLPAELCQKCRYRLRFDRRT